MRNWIHLFKNKCDHIRFWWIVNTRLKPVYRVLDIGGGNHPQELISCVESVIVDPTVTYNHRDGGVTFLKGDWHCANNLRYETVTLINVIEHLEKEEATRLLKQTEDYAKQIVIFTPLGFMEQNDGEWNTHRSGWMSEDFGKGWGVFVFSNYHYCDFKGVTLPEPHGAILAVYTR
jgi:hypothetical protein